MDQSTSVDEFTQVLEQIRDLPCRCCMQHALHAHVQPGFGLRTAQLYVECRNPDCPIYYVTHRFNEWIFFDLAAWHAHEHPAWQPALLAAAQPPVHHE